MVIGIAAEVVVDGVFGKLIAVVESVAVGGETPIGVELDEQPANREIKTTDTASPEMRLRMSTSKKLADWQGLR
jgi:hypothetical protein